jgi:hypothetical protein
MLPVILSTKSWKGEADWTEFTPAWSLARAIPWWQSDGIRQHFISFFLITKLSAIG